MLTTKPPCRCIIKYMILQPHMSHMFLQPGAMTVTSLMEVYSEKHEMREIPTRINGIRGLLCKEKADSNGKSVR